jgi:hypothetical protein
MSEVPNEVPPIELTIFSTVKSVTSGLFAKMSRSICEVRGLSGASNSLGAERGAFREAVEAVEDLILTAAAFVGFLRAAVFFDLPPASMLGRATDALMLFWISLGHIRRLGHQVKTTERIQQKTILK